MGEGLRRLAFSKQGRTRQRCFRSRLALSREQRGQEVLEVRRRGKRKEVLCVVRRGGTMDERNERDITAQVPERPRLPQRAR